MSYHSSRCPRQSHGNTRILLLCCLKKIIIGQRWRGGGWIEYVIIYSQSPFWLDAEIVSSWEQSCGNINARAMQKQWLMDLCEKVHHAILNTSIETTNVEWMFDKYIIIDKYVVSDS